LQFTLRPVAEINAIDDFLTAAKGVSGFPWTTPRGDTKRFTCKEWTPVYNHPTDNSISLKFDQVFEP